MLDGHETPVGVTPMVVAEDAPGSMRVGPDHDEPFHWMAPPDSSTAVQNAAVGQETPAKEEESPYGSGWLHWAPFH